MSFSAHAAPRAARPRAGQTGPEGHQGQVAAACYRGPARHDRGAARPSTRSVTGQASAAYLGEMPRRGAKTEPDLFTLPERKRQPAPLPSRPVLLPDDLVSCLRQLADADLERLQSAVVNEVARRGPPTPPLGRASDPTAERERRVRTSAAPRPRDSPSVPVAPAVTAGKANAIRAAFRAGLKPATIARQFGVPQSVVREGTLGKTTILRTAASVWGPATSHDPTQP